MSAGLHVVGYMLVELSSYRDIGQPWHEAQKSSWSSDFGVSSHGFENSTLFAGGSSCRKIELAWLGVSVKEFSGGRGLSMDDYMYDQQWHGDAGLCRYPHVLTLAVMPYIMMRMIVTIASESGGAEKRRAVFDDGPMRILLTGIL